MSRLPDDEWQELAETLPTKDEPFIGKYLGGRDALVTQEKRLRSDYHFRESLSPIAKVACKVVDKIRDEELRTIWTSQLEDRLAKANSGAVFPGMMFSLAKERMEKTKLWKIVRKMPKGALLHAHTNAMVDFDFLLDLLMTTPGMQIFCEQSLASPEQRQTALIQFRFRKTDTKDASIWNESYKSGTFCPIVQAADSFPDGGRKGFLAWLKDRFTITSSESIKHHHGVNAVWRKFESIFRIVDGIILYEPIFRKFMHRMMSLLVEDGVRWIDLRLAFAGKWYQTGKESPDQDHVHMIKVFGEEIESFKASEAGQSFWGCRMIWTGIRSMDTRGIIEDMDSCLTAKIAYPHLISGYDLVGQEDGGRPLKDVLPELFWFRKQCADEKVEIPFFFHAGETLGDGDDTDQNLFDAILLGTRRIGHGFSLYKHPLLIDMVKDKKICIESCPISNEVLRLTASIMSHPLPALLARGVPCALCNDDPGILGQDTAGMTHDFWQALQGWDNLGLAGLGSLAENSVRYAAFEDQTSSEWVHDIREASLGHGIKAQRMKEWAVEWERFCLWVVTEYGDDSESIRKIQGDSEFDAQD